MITSITMRSYKGKNPGKVTHRADIKTRADLEQEIENCRDHHARTHGLAVYWLLGASTCKGKHLEGSNEVYAYVDNLDKWNSSKKRWSRD